jgi:hypothetical protein
VVDLVEQIAEALSVDPDDPGAATERIGELEADTEEVGDAARRVADYAADECDIDLNPAVEPT